MEEDDGRAGGGERVQCDGVPCGVRGDTYALVCHDNKLRESCVEGKIPFFVIIEDACVHARLCVCLCMCELSVPRPSTFVVDMDTGLLDRLVREVGGRFLFHSSLAP